MQMYLDSLLTVLEFIIMISGSTLEIDSSWIISPLTNAMINIGQLLVLGLCRPHFLPFKEKFDHLKRNCKVTLQIFVGSYRQWDSKKWRTKFHYSEFMYTNSLVHADLFYANFTNKTFQKKPHSLLNTYYKTESPSLTKFSLHFLLTCLTRCLVNMTFS